MMNEVVNLHLMGLHDKMMEAINNREREVLKVMASNSLLSTFILLWGCRMSDAAFRECVKRSQASYARCDAEVVRSGYLIASSAGLLRPRPQPAGSRQTQSKGRRPVVRNPGLLIFSIRRVPDERLTRSSQS